MKIFKYLKTFFTFIIKEVFASLIFLIVLFAIISVVAINFYKTKENNPIVEGNTYLELSFPNGIKENNEFTFSLLDKKQDLTLFDIIDTINYSATDDKISGIILDLDNINLGFSQIEELEKALKNFKTKGKKIVGFAYNFNKANYLLGSVANRLYMDPSASTEFSLEGFKVNIPYSKSLTDKLGIEFQIVHIGDFKTYGENYVKSSISEESKASYNKILKERMNYFIETISTNKELDMHEFKKQFLAGNFILLNSKKAQDKKFIDNRISFDSFYDYAGIKKTITLNKYNSLVLRERKNDKIAVIVAEGDINTTSEFNEGITPSLIESQIDKVIDDTSIKAVVLRINSPGGSALASEIIYQKLLTLKKKKPVYISIGDVAASGGYYMAVAGNKIFANKNSITGSVGVVSMFFNLEKLYDKLGLSFQTLELGTNLDYTDLSSKPSKEELDLIKNSMTDIYNEFKQRVASGRKLKLETVETLARGQIYTGIEAKNNKLIDEIGGLDDTIIALAADLKLKNYEVIFYPKDFDKLEKLLDLKRFMTKSKTFNKLNEFEKKLNFIEEINNKPSLYFPINFN